MTNTLNGKLREEWRKEFGDNRLYSLHPVAGEVFGRDRNGVVYKGREENLNNIFEFFASRTIPKAELVEKIEGMKKETRVLEDGVPVETYGYEETYNQALDDIIQLLSNPQDR